ncbi:MAG: VWA domain-containing protein [Candidatus Aenigmarchaeota archaeon]|nr:VWA domain-containing protein [Candidatus Aenigmarchaeota archaeon]
MRGSRGFLLSMDAVFAVSILVLVGFFMVSLLHTYSSPDLRYQRYYYTGKDMVYIFEQTPMSSVEFLPVIQNYLATGVLEEGDMGRSILDVIGSLWTSGNISEAGNITKDILDALLNETGHEYEIMFGGERIYNSSAPPVNNFLARLTTLVSGYEKTKPVDGYVAKVYLSKAKKTTSDFLYFGGYVGEGNISRLTELPADANVSLVYMEMNIGNNFSFYINDNYAGTYNKTKGNFSADKWTVCSSALNPGICSLFGGGNNTIEINFTSVENSSIGGGYMKITYTTSELTGFLYTGNTSTDKYWFPGIEGIINLYSSFHVPGTLSNISAYLHYKSNYPVYFTIGNVTLYSDSNTSEKMVIINNSFINSSIFKGTGIEHLNYISNRTVPIRMGTANLSYLFGLGQRADVVLITDRTGSMDSCDVDISCSEPGICDPWSPCHERRYKIVQDSNKAFLDAILNTTGNRVGMIGYGKRASPVCSFRDLTGDNESLRDRIDDYANEWCGWTCISCGIESATKLAMETQTLYATNMTSEVNTTWYDIGDDYAGKPRSVNVAVNITFDPQRFVKARLTVFGRDLDANNKYYKNCVYLNGKYLGRMCYPAEDSSDGYHDCVYDVRQEWLNQGINIVNVTSGTTADCNEIGGSHDDWNFKDVRITLWELQNLTKNTKEFKDNIETTINYPGGFVFKDYADIWELTSDLPYPIDFTSGLNWTFNTFGPGSGDDGWDWDNQDGSGPYGWDDNVDYAPVTGGELVLDMVTGSPARNRCSNYDCSGAYGIEVNITDEIYSYIAGGDWLYFSMDYEWDGNDEPFEDSDQVWIKGRWYSPTSGYHYLGSDMDSGDWGSDGDEEIDTRNNPDDDFSGNFYQNLTQWIEGQGMYYLDIGGKILGTESSEWGYFMFDNIAIGITNSSYYSPPTSEIINVTMDMSINKSNLKAGRLVFEAKDVDPYYYNCIYLNDNFIGRVRHQEWSGTNVWQNVTFDLPAFWINNGENNLTFTAGSMEDPGTGIDGGCRRTGSGNTWSFRNVSITTTESIDYVPYNRFKAMLVMSDGHANTRIGDCNNCQDGDPTPSQEAIDKACEAHDKYNISIYSVAFGSGADTDTLRDIACCDNCSNFYVSSDSDELVEIYRQIARDILEIAFKAQAVVITGEVKTNNTLYPDSYISYEYKPISEPLSYGEITLKFESPRLGDVTGNSTITDNLTGTKEGWFFIQNNTRVLDSKITSYSSYYWTDRLWINSSNTPNQNWTNVYWLGNFSSDYGDIGDPYVINIPVNLLKPGGNNSVRLGTGLGPVNGTGGSPDSRVIYTLGITGVGLQGYSGVFQKLKGSTVTIYYDSNGDNVPDGSSQVQVGPFPSDVFDPQNDSVDDAFMRLMDMLNFINDTNPNTYGDGTFGEPYDAVNQTNPIDLEITPEVSFSADYISQIPSLWGPSELEIRIWG